MKKFILLMGAASLLVCNISCDSLTAGAGIPIPFTNGGADPVRVGLNIEAKVLPPKFCIGLDVKNPEQ
jgi:hypothetical protein